MIERRAEKLKLAEDAADWVLRRMEDRSTECGAEFVQWLKLSPRHMDEFLMAAATYATLKGSAAPARMSVDALLAGNGSNVLPLEIRTGAVPEKSSRRSSGRRIGLAAVVAAVTAGALGFWLYIGQAGTYVTEVGEQRAIRLEDGSLVQMNTRSKLQVRFSKETRELRLLDGEALFTVAQETQRPFRVVTASATVQALGTQFNIYARARDTKVSVIEGRIKVAVNASSVAPAVLTAGEQADVVNGRRVAKIHNPDVKVAVAWRERRMVFRAVPLADVVQEFNRYNEGQIRIDGEPLSRRLIWGIFLVDEPQALLLFLQRETGLSVERTGDDVVIREREKQNKDVGRPRAK